MKRCAKDNLEFPDDRRFCTTCGTVLVEEFESATLMMPKVKIKQAEFIETLMMPKMKPEQSKLIEMNDDLTFRLSIRDKTYKLSMDEAKALAAEVCATVKTAERHLARPEN